MVERPPEKWKVTGSMPVGATIAPIAQWIERLSTEQKVGGSSPFGCTAPQKSYTATFILLQNSNHLSLKGFL